MSRIACGPMIVMALTAMLAGCASAPVQYLTLVPSASQGAADDGGPLGAVVSVTIPEMAPESLSEFVAGKVEGTVRHTIPRTNQPTELFGFFNIGFA